MCVLFADDVYIANIVANGVFSFYQQIKLIHLIPDIKFRLPPLAGCLFVSLTLTTLSIL